MFLARETRESHGRFGHSRKVADVLWLTCGFSLFCRLCSSWKAATELAMALSPGSLLSTIAPRQGHASLFDGGPQLLQGVHTTDPEGIMLSQVPASSCSFPFSFLYNYRMYHILNTPYMNKGHSCWSFPEATDLVNTRESMAG